MEKITGKNFVEKTKNVSESARLLKNEFSDKETKEKASIALSGQKKSLMEYNHSIG